MTVLEVLKGSAAGRAGLREKDVIVSVAGQKAAGRAMVTRLVGAQPVGSMLALGIRRGKDTLTINVPVVENLP